MKKFSDFPPVRRDGLFLLRRPVATLAALDVDRLNKAAGVDLKCYIPQLLKWLNFSLKMNAAPKVKDVIAHLEQIAATSRTLAGLLSNSKTTAIAIVGASLATDEVEEINFDEVDGEEKIAKLRESILALADCASSHAMELRPAKQGIGAPKDIFLRLLVPHVCEIYDAASGKKNVGAYYHAVEERYRGPIVDLTCELLAQAKNVGVTDYSRSAVAQKIITYRRPSRVRRRTAAARG